MSRNGLDTVSRGCDDTVGGAVRFWASPRCAGGLFGPNFAMKRHLFLLSLLVLCLSALPAHAQRTGSGMPSTPKGSFSGAPRVGDLVDEPKGLGWGLLDPSRFKMHQSYSVSYISGSGQSGSLGVYQNTLEYQLFRPLTLRVGLGFYHQPFGNSGGQAGDLGVGKGFFIPGASLEYNPSSNFHMAVEFRQIPQGAWGQRTWGADSWSPYSRWYDPWGW